MHAAITVNELLLCSKRCVVRFAGTLHHLEIPSKFMMQALGAIAYHLQTAALLRSIWSKCRDNHMPTLADCMPYGIHIALAVSGLGQEVEYRAIMPEAIGLLRYICPGNIGLDPVHMQGMWTKALAGEL